jgi:hypothetical protein
MVGVGFVPTSNAGELGLTATIPFLDIATAATSPTGVAGIHKHDRYAQSLRFVDEKVPQLPKTPVMLLRPLRFGKLKVYPLLKLITITDILAL